MSKDIKAWSEKIKRDKNFAQGYKDLASVASILKKAKSDGYNITEDELKELDFINVAGGVGAGGVVVDTTVHFDPTITTSTKKLDFNQHTAEGSTINSSTNISM